MPNNRYLRSVGKERYLVNQYRKLGAIAARSAGSHSPIDVWIFHPKEAKVIMIQVKTKKGARNLKMTQLSSQWVKAERYLFQYE